MRRRDTARPTMDDRGYDASTAITSGCTISIIRYIVRSNVWLAWWLFERDDHFHRSYSSMKLFCFVSFVSLMKISFNLLFIYLRLKRREITIPHTQFEILISRSIRSSRLEPQDGGFQYCEMIEENWKGCIRRSHPLVVVRRRTLSSVERTRGWIRSRSFRV